MIAPPFPAAVTAQLIDVGVVVVPAVWLLIVGGAGLAAYLLDRPRK